MAISVNILELTRQVFSLTGYTPYLNPTEQPVLVDNTQIEVFPDPESIGVSVFDTPIFETIALKSPIDGSLFQFEDAPLISVSGRKKIVKSVITNRNGTVKEFINTDDYVIRVRGVLVNHEGITQPFEKIEALNNVLSPGQALEVESKLLQSFNIFNVVVRSFKSEPSDAYPNVRQYEFECLSDEPIELNLEDITVQDV